MSNEQIERVGTYLNGFWALALVLGFGYIGILIHDALTYDIKEPDTHSVFAG